MSYGLYIDPGVQKHACAWFEAELGALLSVGFLEPEEFILPASHARPPWHEVSTLVIEKMQIYGTRGEEDPNDLLDVHGAARFAEAAIRIGGGPRPLWPKPREWKQQTKKWIHHHRIWGVLTPLERVRFAVCTKRTVEETGKYIEDACIRWARGEVTKRGEVKGYSWKEHNLLDAVGLGLWHNGRIGIGGASFGRVAKV